MNTNTIEITSASIAQVSAAIKGTGPRVDRETYKAHVPAHVTKAGQVVAPIRKPTVAPSSTSNQFLKITAEEFLDNLKTLPILREGLKGEPEPAQPLVLHSEIPEISDDMFRAVFNIDPDNTDEESLEIERHLHGIELNHFYQGYGEPYERHWSLIIYKITPETFNLFTKHRAGKILFSHGIHSIDHAVAVVIECDCYNPPS